MRPKVFVVFVSLIAILVAGSALAGNIYKDPPQVARPVSIVSDAGWTFTNALDEVDAMNEQTPNCSGALCNYASGTGTLVLIVRLSELQKPEVYDVFTQSLNQTVWFQAMSTGSGTAEQISVVAATCTAGIVLASFITPLSRIGWQVFFFRVPSDLTGYFDDLCLQFTGRLLGAGETARVSWAEMRVPPAKAHGPSAFPLIIALSGLLVVSLEPWKKERRKR